MREVFAMAPTGASANWFFGLIILLFLGLLLLMSYLAWSTKNSSFVLDETHLQLRGDLWGRKIPRSALHADQARVVHLGRERELQLHRRTMGTGLPGFASGWFKLRNGEKSLVYLSDQTRAVYIPTDEGYSLLLSPTDPNRFLAALQRRRG